MFLDYLKKSIVSWQFVKDRIIDKVNKEWFWGLKENHELLDEDEVFIWKCPYHNTRACIEIFKRIDKVMASNSRVANETN